MVLYINQFGIERNDKVLNHKQLHESRVNYRIWENLIMYAKIT